MARRITLEKGWTLSGYRAQSDIGGAVEVAEVAADFPASVEGTLERAGLIPGFLADGRASEWVNSRVWAAECSFSLPPEPEGALSERHHLHINDLFGSGWVEVNGRPAGSFGSGASLALDVTGLINEAGENSLRVVFGKNDIAALERTREVYGDIIAPMTAARGIGGAVYMSGTSYAKIAAVSAAASGGKVKIAAEISAANRGKYTLKYRLHSGKTLAGSANVTENLMACLQTVQREIEVSQEDDLCLRLTVERGGVRCDFCDVLVAREAKLPAPGNIRAVAWAPLSPHLCDVAPERYRRAVELLKAMGANAILLRKCVFERSVLLEECARQGITVVDEGVAESAEKIFLSGKADPRRAVMAARSALKPIAIYDMVSLTGDGGEAVFAGDCQTGEMYGLLSQALGPWAACIEQAGPDSPNHGGSELRLVSCCDNLKGEAVAAEVAFLDASGATLLERSFHFVQKERVAKSAGFWAFFTVGAAPTQVDIRLYAGGAVVFEGRCPSNS